MDKELRDSVFELGRKFQELHLVICKAMIEETKELEEKAEMMLREIKILVREL